MDMKDLLEMKLHDEIEPWKGFRIVRVPGGWLYLTDNEQAGGHWQTSQSFVPEPAIKGVMYG